jgi:restriction system protein
VSRRSSGHPDPQRSRNERIERQVARELRAESEREQARAAREAKQRERDARDAEQAARRAAAKRRTSDLQLQVTELTSILRRCVATPASKFADLAVVSPRPFEPGDDGEPLREPHRPVMPEGNWFNRRARRQWFDEQMERYERDWGGYETAESERRRRVEAAAAEHDRQEAQRRSSARERAATLSSGVGRGEPGPIEEFARLAIEALPMPGTISLQPSVVYRTDPRELVIDLRLPDDDVVPTEKSVKYVQARNEDTIKELPKTTREAIYRAVLAQLPLAAGDAVLRALEPELVQSVSINGKLTYVDPATGNPRDDFLVSLTTSRDEFARLNLNAAELDPVLCVRELGARLSPHPLAREHPTVPDLRRGQVQARILGRRRRRPRRTGQPRDDAVAGLRAAGP